MRLQFFLNNIHIKKIEKCMLYNSIKYVYATGIKYKNK